MAKLTDTQPQKQTQRDKRVELVHIGILVAGLVAINQWMFTRMSPDTPLLYPLGAAFVWVLVYYTFVKSLPRKWSGQP